MSRLVAPKLLIPSLGQGERGAGSPAEFESAPSESRPSSNLATSQNRPLHPRCDGHAPRPIASIESFSSRSDSKDSSLPLPFSQRPDPLHSAWSAESEVVSQADPISPSSALGGAISTFGAPAEWWHDSIILGRLSALALRYFATKAVKKPWKAWLRYLDAVRHKEESRLRSQLQLALRLWRRRTVWHGRRLAPKRPLLLALQRIAQTHLAPVWGRLRQAVFAQRDVERRLRVLHLIRRKMMETMAQVHYYQSLLRLGLAALWLAVKVRDTSSSSVASAPVAVCSTRHTHVQQVLSRAWRRWRFATRMWLSSAQYRERELEAWLTGECSTPRSMILAEAFESLPVAETERPVSATAMSSPSPDIVRRHPFLAEGSSGLQVQAEVEPLLLQDDQAMDAGTLGRQAWLQRSRKLSTAQRSRQLSQVSGKSSKGKDLDKHRRHSSEDSGAGLATPSVPDNRQQRTYSNQSSDAE
ncbi:unnamed protein product, partial [Symbiodinium necroappetens]